MKKKVLIVGIVLLALYFRVSSLLDFPPALYWEEVALGYDAYSILKTGRDHHGNALPIIAFESFGDWKPSLYFYYLVPFIAIFGLSDFAIRAAAVVVGVLFLTGIPFLAKHLKISGAVSLAVVAVSPWAIHFSRSAWEAYLAATLILWAVVAGLKAAQSTKIVWWIVSIVLFALSMYTYHAARVIAPSLLMLILLYSLPVQYGNLSLAKLTHALIIGFKKYFAVLALFLLLILPLALAFLSNDEAVTHRFLETNIFSDISIINHSNEFKALNNNSLVSRVLYHRYILFGQEILKNIFSYFQLDYLIISGDENSRHSTGYTGIVYPIELLFLITGLYSLIRKSLRTTILLLGWLTITLLPAAVSIPNPHALRTVIALPVYVLIISEGIVSSFVALSNYFLRFKLFHAFSSRWGKSLFQHRIKAALIIFFVLVYAIQVTFFWRYYSTIYAHQSSSEWQYGYAELVSVLESTAKGQPVYISRTIGRPAMYYWFYTKTDPVLVQSENSIASKDQSEFLSFQNLRFVRSIGEIELSDHAVVAVPSQEHESLVSRIEELGFKVSSNTEIKDINDKVVWNVVTVGQ